MRILYFSDAHLEILESQTRFSWTDAYPLDLGPEPGELVGTADLCILAGDIATARDRRGVDAVGYSAQLAAELRCPVILVPGNHEYYGGRFDEDRKTMLSSNAPGVTVLDRGEKRLAIEGRTLRVLGATLWTDYALAGDAVLGALAAKRGLNDHRMIKIRTNETWSPDDALAEHQASAKWLLDKLAEPVPDDVDTLVVTHHVPHSAARHPGYPVDHFSASFYSDRNDLVEAAEKAKAIAWICGHHHWTLDVEIGGLRLLSAQPGYPGERTGWAGIGILDVPPKKS